MTTEGERADLAADFPGWRVWRWQRLIYAQRLKTSPPLVLKDATAKDLRAQMQAAENGRRPS